MKKILLLAAVAAVVYWFLSRYQASKDKSAEYMLEQDQLHKLGTIAQDATIFAKAQSPPTRVVPADLLGAILTPTNGDGLLISGFRGQPIIRSLN